MSIIRDFVTNLPAACGVPNEPVTFTWVDKDGVERTETKGLADMFGELNGKLFDFELANPDGPLHRRNFPDTYERVALGFVPWQDLCGGYSRSQYAHDLLTFAAKTAHAKGGDWDGKEYEIARLLKDQANPENAPVVALMTVEQASTLGSWV